MRDVDEITGTIARYETKKLGDVTKKGYTYFREKDVIFAKITPCMENGKAAIALGLRNGIGFGSTEFHVLRAKDFVLPKWIYYFVRQLRFRNDARRSFTGTAGQQRVPISFMVPYKIPIPPIQLQTDIIAKIEASVGMVRHVQSQITEMLRLQETAGIEIQKIETSVFDMAFNGRLC